jgi:hypothetical protein
VRLRIYADTSVIGGCFDAEFKDASRKLFDMFVAGDHVLVMSELTTTELKNAPPPVANMVSTVPAEHKVVLQPPTETERLAGLYIAAGVVPKHSWSDAQHIAIATLSDVDVLVSWNFKHIVNLRRIRGYNAVNSGLGTRSWRSARHGRLSMANDDFQIDAVGLMRRLRDEIDRTVENMTEEERREYIRRSAAEAARLLNLPPSVPAPRGVRRRETGGTRYAEA